jgi:hypothetical protein
MPIPGTDRQVNNRKNDLLAAKGHFFIPEWCLNIVCTNNVIKQQNHTHELPE